MPVAAAGAFACLPPPIGMASPNQPLARSQKPAVVAVKSSRRPPLTSSIPLRGDVPDSTLEAFRRGSGASQGTPRQSAGSSRGTGSSYLSGGTDYFNLRKNSTASSGSLSTAASCLHSDGKSCRGHKARDMESLLPSSRMTVPKARPTGMTPSPHETQLDLQVVGRDRPNASMRPGLAKGLSRTESVQIRTAQTLKPTLKIGGYFLSPDASSPLAKGSAKPQHRRPKVRVGEIFLDSDTAEFYKCIQVGAYEHEALQAHLPVKLEQCYPNTEAYDLESNIKFIQERHTEGKKPKARILIRLKQK